MNPRRLRLVLLVAGLVGAALVLGAWTQPWFELTVADAHDLTVRGQDATPALSVIALAAVALVAALMIARPRLRIALGAVQLVLGVVASALVAPLAFSVEAAKASTGPTITAATGISGQAAVQGIESFVATVWPLVALAGSVLIGVAGLAVALTWRRWPAPATKYDTTAARPDTDAGTWDALSEGDDPTAR
jgi:hypothetical protein